MWAKYKYVPRSARRALRGLFREVDEHCFAGFKRKFHKAGELVKMYEFYRSIEC